MRRRLLPLLLCLLVLTTGTSCAGTRPSLSDPTAAAAGATGGSGSTGPSDAKIAGERAKPGDTSVVATAAVPRVEIFDAPNAARSSRSLANPTADGAPLVFLVDGAQAGWLRVLLPVRPNGSTGWIRSSDITLSRHNFHIEVSLSGFRMTVYRGAEVVLDAPVGVAKDNTPTPGGRYYTTELLKPPDPNTVYGTYAYGLSGFSEVLQSFNGGPGQLGIHGTNDPSSIGKKVSSGCIRMRNADIEKLAVMLPLGVPVIIT
jgi:lipoprotein-anchoring transpeptidase ErfK/SrfK